VHRHLPLPHDLVASFDRRAPPGSCPGKLTRFGAASSAAAPAFALISVQIAAEGDRVAGLRNQ
jgi:hypothetical protein